jgi:elongation factor P hydroxylase
MYKPICDAEVAAVYIKDFTIGYIKQTDKDSSTTTTYDRIYKNTMDSVFANELDEIEFKICSDNNDGVCYSKVILNNGFLNNNLYSALDSGMIRPEEKLIKRIVNFYNDTRIKLTQVLKRDDAITPMSTFIDSYMSNKTFSMMCGSIDYQDDSFTVIMLEI